MLNKFFENTKRAGLRIYSAVLYKGGEKIAEYSVPPYNTKPQKPFRMYSATKSVVAIAIMRLIDEGKISLNDKVVKFFNREFDLTNVHPYLKETTIKNLLTMQTPFAVPTYGANRTDWLKSYFTEEPNHPSGTVWNYDSCGSYVLGAIVKRVSGKYFDEYLKPLFKELGCSEDICCLKGPDGESWAGSGLIATTEDIAKCAYLLVNRGKWQKKQLISKQLVQEAISPITPNRNNINNYYTKAGYGYQIWCLPNGAFRFHGMCGQLAIGFPNRDLVFACNSDLSGLPEYGNYIIDAVYRDIIPHFEIVNPENTLSEIIPKPSNKFIEKINLKRYILNNNSANITSFTLKFTDNLNELIYERSDGNKYKIPFSLKEEISFLFPEKYSGTKLFDKSHFMNYECRASAEWISENQLLIKIYATDIYISSLSLCFGFKNNEVTLLGTTRAQFFFDDFNVFTAGKTNEH